MSNVFLSLSPWQNEVMFLVALVCLSVCLSVCLPVGEQHYSKKLLTDCNEILQKVLSGTRKN